MMKRAMLTAMAILLLATVAMAADSTAARPEAPRFENLDSAKAFAAKDSRPIILDFYADW